MKRKASATSRNSEWTVELSPVYAGGVWFKSHAHFKLDWTRSAITLAACRSTPSSCLCFLPPSSATPATPSTFTSCSYTMFAFTALYCLALSLANRQPEHCQPNGNFDVGFAEYTRRLASYGRYSQDLFGLGFSANSATEPVAQVYVPAEHDPYTSCSVAPWLGATPICTVDDPGPRSTVFTDFIYNADPITVAVCHRISILHPSVQTASRSGPPS